MIGIADHERIDAAARGAGHGRRPRPAGPRSWSARRSPPAAATCWACSSSGRVPALRTLRGSIEAVHDQGGIAIPAHPLVPYPLCAQGFVAPRLLEDADPAVRPDTIETFNPTAFGRVRPRPWCRFARGARPDAGGQQRRPRRGGGRDGLDVVPRPDGGGRAARDPPGRPGTTARSTGRSASSGCSGASSASTAATRGPSSAGRVRRDGTGRDLGYPGGTSGRRATTP